MKIIRKLSFLVMFLAGITLRGAETNELKESIHELQEQLSHAEAKLNRQINELMWFQRLSDVAIVDKVQFTGPPAVNGTNRIVDPSSNHVIVSAFTFMPRERARAKKLPLIVLAHGEIHGNVATDEELHTVRDLLQQGYALIAPDYRGSSGYGGDYWRQIDYGGLEIEDVHAAREFMLQSYPEIDSGRVGMLGWSHGGLIALLTVMKHPRAYRVCYAGVPVSDLETRLKTHGKDYEQLFAAPYHLGKTFSEAPEEYHRRSPARNAKKLETPLLVDANTNDEDVKIVEVEKLLQELKTEKKAFQYRIYTNAPGGHYFNRLDTPAARASREEIWKFLAGYLHPPKPR